MKALTLLTLAIASLVILTPSRAATLAGSQVTLTIDLPTLGKASSIPVTKAVPATFPSGSIASTTPGVFIIGVNIDVNATNIDLNYTQSSTALTATFNGYVFDFSNAPPITGVSLDPLSTFKPSQVGLSFHSNEIAINVEGLSFNSTSRILVDLQFGSGTPAVQAATSASAFGAFPTFGPGSWIEVYGTDLASVTQTWATADFNGVNAPTSLGGTSVTIGGQPAFVDYVSPLQVNAQVPLAVSTGTQPLVVTNGDGGSTALNVTVEASRPGLLAPAALNIGGVQYAAAFFSDGAFVAPPGAIPGVTSRRAQPGDTIVLYGVGFGAVNPNTPPGQIAAGENSIASPFTLSIGGIQAMTVYDGLAPGYVGLYQFNVLVPQVAASDTAPLTFTLNGVSGSQKLVTAVGNGESGSKFVTTN
jgi:uncharacterized protein (TIGR03437 family)